jgi:hypothetical protein
LLRQSPHRTEQRRRQQNTDSGAQSPRHALRADARLKASISLLASGRLLGTQREPQVQRLQHVGRRQTDIVTAEQRVKIDRNVAAEPVKFQALDLAVLTNPGAHFQYGRFRIGAGTFRDVLLQRARIFVVGCKPLIEATLRLFGLWVYNWIMSADVTKSYRCVIGAAAANIAAARKHLEGAELHLDIGLGSKRNSLYASFTDEPGACIVATSRNCFQVAAFGGRTLYSCSSIVRPKARPE